MFGKGCFKRRHFEKPSFKYFLCYKVSKIHFVKDQFESIIEAESIRNFSKRSILKYNEKKKVS